ncbi:MAG: 2-oxoacid:acceptor oxidoreductase family protein, partial [Rhodocyclaceae bacterium]|nr:2-oxoacid:acceptor oxidoreductase family protein [Rhodocyclaceae bacterium]
DYSCLKGFCPSFITIEGGRLARGRAARIDESQFAEPPMPALPDTTRPYGIMVTGVGGTGVVTIGALIGMAAHLDDRGVTVLDMTGLAQKGGSVFSHIRIANDPDDLHAVRIAAGEADAVIGGDVVVTASVEALAKMAGQRSRVIVNCAETPTSDFARNPDWQFPLDKMELSIVEAVGRDSVDFLDAQAIATRLLGDAIATNLFLLGYAWQKGLVPVSHEALQQAIELNGVALELNRKAFLWGRRAACDLAAVLRVASPAEVTPLREESLDEVIARRMAYLVDYQDAAYAERYRRLVSRVRTAEAALGSTRLTDTVARQAFRLMAYKDEYEVARLYGDASFWQSVRDTFDGDYAIRFHLAPPLISRPDPNTGRIAKRTYGKGLLRVFRLLARLKGLRGGRWDLFGKTDERRAERAWIGRYEQDVLELIDHLSFDRLPLALEIAGVPAMIRGFGHVKLGHMAEAEQRRSTLFERWRAVDTSRDEAVARAA